MSLYNARTVKIIVDFCSLVVTIKTIPYIYLLICLESWEISFLFEIPKEYVAMETQKSHTYNEERTKLAIFFVYVHDRNRIYKRSNRLYRIYSILGSVLIKIQCKHA